MGFGVGWSVEKKYNKLVVTSGEGEGDKDNIRIKD